MSTSTDSQPAPIASLLSAPLHVGDPDVVGPLAVFPVFGADAPLAFESFTQGRERGVRVGELESGASVNDLVVENPGDTAVLLFEGEEVLGAQQNRTFDVSVLVGAGAKLRVPVSCVEVGRWQGSRHSDALEPAPQAAYPRMRRLKSMAITRNVAVGAEARADQGEVWDEVRLKSERMGTASPTGAMHDIYEDRRGRLAQMKDGVELRPGQIGTIAATGAELLCLDVVARAEVFASLHGPLVQGYALDALDSETEAPVDAPATETASGFALLATDCDPTRREAGIGLGETQRYAENGVAGTALAHEGALIQLTAFPDGPDEAGAPPRRTVRSGRVNRPSRRAR